MATPDEMDLIEEQIRECYGRIVWTHKTQEKCADILFRWNGIIKWTQIILSGVTTTGILAAVFGELPVVGLISALISTILLILNSYTKKYDIGETALKHAHCASSLWNIRESYLSLLVEIRSRAADASKIKERRDSLQEELNNVYKGCPRSFESAYKKTTKALKECEEMTFSDNEIDSLLPIGLRKCNPYPNEED